jgi:glycosyltransferase involved in cell wall biosynthesis
MNGAQPRILMVGPWPPSHGGVSAFGGVTTFMCNVVRSPLKERYEFVPFTTSRPSKRNIEGDNYGYAAVFRGGLKRVVQGILITLWHLALYPFVVLARRPAVIQVQASDFQAFWEASLYVLMARILRRPLVLRIGGSFNRFWESSGAQARSAIRWVLRQPSVLVVQSQYWKDYVAGFGRPGPTVILNNFVPEALVQKRDASAPEVRRFLLACGEAPKLKGAYVLLDALRQLIARAVKAQVTLMAVTPALREEIVKAGLDAHVTMLDFLSHEEALATLRRTDVFLQISDSEGFPNMLLEAMALGCAAIVTPVGAVPEIVGPDGGCAFIIPRGDAASLAERMTRLATEPGLCARMAAAAQARVAGNFSERTVTRVLDHAYQLAMREARSCR